MDLETLNKIDKCRYLLPEPGAEVVGELVSELRESMKRLEVLEGLINTFWAGISDQVKTCSHALEDLTVWQKEWERAMGQHENE